MTALVWFRRDLRVHDNAALSAACAKSGQRVIAVFMLTPAAWRKHDTAACQVEFMLRTLEVLKTELAKLNIPLLIRTTDDGRTKTLLEEIIAYYDVDTLYFNKEYEVDELARDQQVAKLCEQLAIKYVSFDDQAIESPNSVVNQSAKPYMVFTPFKKAIYARWQQRGVPALYPTPKRQANIQCAADKIPTTLSAWQSTIDPKLWPAGEVHAKRRLQKFCEELIVDYKKLRDVPSAENTSVLSPYLAVGAISARQCLHAALGVNRGEFSSGNQGVVTWISELLWRDFYRHILVAFPRVCRHQPFQLATKKIRWRDDKAAFKQWCNGQTGIPIIDAAMRQLNTIGWMHNRLRMIVAMFLTKNLWIDWRWGEKYFMQQLIDGDFASNNGGWQWSASTGTDAAPYFRIMNPVTQSERFDPDGEFIRQFCPELKELNNREIHDPTKRCASLPEGYPKALVDLKITRQRAIEAFKKIK